MRPRRSDLVAHARRAAAGGPNGVAAAIRLLDRVARERVWLLGAWLRRCAALDDPAEIAARTETALAGGTVGDPAFDGLGLLAAEVRLPPGPARDVLAGLALDAEEWRPRSEADLLRHCYRSGGAVACLVAVALGVSSEDEATLDRACDLGIAVRLAAILRNLERDDRAGRCWLPVEWIAEMDIPPGQHLKPPFRQRLVVLVERLDRLRRAHAHSGRQGAAALGFRPAWAALTAVGISDRLARDVVVRGAHGWDHRATLSPAQKLAAILRAARQARARRRLYSPAPCDGDLWMRPRST